MCRTNIQQFIQFDILDYRILLPSSNIAVEWYRIEDSPWSRCSPTQFQTWFLHSHIGSAILLAPKNRMLAMLAPSSARSSAARVFYPSKIIIDWLHDFPNLQRIQCSIENNRSPCKTSLLLDAACLSKVHLKLFALSPPHNARLVQRSLHKVSSESGVIEKSWISLNIWWCSTEFECLCARSILVSRGRQQVTTLQIC